MNVVPVVVNAPVWKIAPSNRAKKFFKEGSTGTFRNLNTFKNVKNAASISDPT